MNYKNESPPSKPICRGAIHQAAFYSSVGAGLMLIAAARSPTGRIGALIYVLSLIGLFGISALYHRPQWNAAARNWLRKIDHATIYLLIAGSATPIFLLGLNSTSGTRLLWTIWIAAVLGATKSFFWPKAPRFINALIYIGVGCLAAPSLQELHLTFGNFGISLLLSSAFIYIVGAAIYVLKRPDPFPKIFGYHEVFHSMVVIASLFQFKLVYDLVKGH